MSLAVVLASSLVAPVGALAAQTAVVTGSVLPSVHGTQIARTVWVGTTPAAVGTDGTFRVDGIPAGPAQLAIETSEGIYLAAAPINLAPGTTRSLHLALRGRQDTSPAPAPEKEKKKKPGGVWANPVTATLIVVGSAIVVGVAIDQLTKSNTTPASPSTP
jgi:hypothetical protein